MEKRREEWKNRVATAQTTTAQVVENPDLKKWLHEQDERNTLKIMHAGDAPGGAAGGDGSSAGASQSLRARAGPRLHTVLQELKKIEQQVKILTERKLNVAATADWWRFTAECCLLFVPNPPTAQSS